MAFGTMATCYVPVERRKGGKHPAQRRSFKGAILGYVDGMPAYRVWDFESKTIRSASFNFTICHEGYYPFRDQNNWPSECLGDPSNFSPVVDGILTTTEWKKFDFDPEDTSEIFQMAPGLLVDRPGPLPIAANFPPALLPPEASNIQATRDVVETPPPQLEKFNQIALKIF
jgi:hypothetical protein